MPAYKIEQFISGDEALIACGQSAEFGLCHIRKKGDSMVMVRADKAMKAFPQARLVRMQEFGDFPEEAEFSKEFGSIILHDPLDNTPRVGRIGRGHTYPFTVSVRYDKELRKAHFTIASEEPIVAKVIPDRQDIDTNLQDAYKRRTQPEE